MADIKKISAGGVVYNVKDEIVRNPEFEDFTANGVTIPDARAAIAEMRSKTNHTTLWSKAKAALMGLVTLGEMRALLVNNGLCTEAGKFFLDAAFGKTLQDQVTQLNSDLSITSSQSDMTEAELNKTDIREFKIGRISNTVSTSIGLANSTFQVMCIPFYNSYPGQLFLSVGRTPAIIYHRCCINGQWQAPVLLASENDLYKAKYVSDLMGAQDYPVFVYWDSNTKNTPYATGKTSSTQGFAIAYGNYSTHQTVFAMAKGTSDIFIHYCSNGSPSGWLVK